MSYPTYPSLQSPLIQAKAPKNIHYSIKKSLGLPANHWSWSVESNRFLGDVPKERRSALRLFAPFRGLEGWEVLEQIEQSMRIVDVQRSLQSTDNGNTDSATNKARLSRGLAARGHQAWPVQQ